MKTWFVEHLPESVTALIALIGAWFTQRGARIRSLGKRVTKLEADRVTRYDFDQLTASLSSQLAQNQTRTEERLNDLSDTQRLILDKLIPGAGER